MARLAASAAARVIGICGRRHLRGRRHRHAGHGAVLVQVEDRTPPPDHWHWAPPPAGSSICRSGFSAHRPDRPSSCWPNRCPGSHAGPRCAFFTGFSGVVSLLSRAAKLSLSDLVSSLVTVLIVLGRLVLLHLELRHRRHRRRLDIAQMRFGGGDGCGRWESRPWAAAARAGPRRATLVCSAIVTRSTGTAWLSSATATYAVPGEPGAAARISAMQQQRRSPRHSAGRARWWGGRRRSAAALLRVWLWLDRHPSPARYG